MAEDRVSEIVCDGMTMCNTDKKNNILYSFLNTTNILFFTLNTEIQYVQIYIILVLYIFNVVRPT